MAKEILVNELLTEQMISAGIKLIQRLDASSSCVSAALWMFLQEEKTWKFILSSPFVKKEGPRKYYKRIVDANKQADTDENILSLNDVSVLDINSHIIQLLKLSVSTTNAISSIRFSKNTINGYFIDDTYIYRMDISNITNHSSGKQKAAAA